MSTILNDRDAILQASAVRIVNPKNAAILLAASAPAFHVNAAGAADLASITVTATLVGLEGAVSFSAEGATLTAVTERSATVAYADMQGATAIVTASIASGGERFAQSCILATVQDGLPGSSAKTVKLTPSEQVFKIGKTGTNTPASITLTALGQNTSGTPGFSVVGGSATLGNGSSAAQKVLAFSGMGSDSVTVEVTLDGQKDRVTLYKVREGQDGAAGATGATGAAGADALVGLLTNETVTLPAASNGTVSSVSGAACTMKVYKGTADDSANWSYAFAPASAAARLSYTTSGATVTVTAMAAGVDTAYVDITASKSGAASITKRFTVSKSRAGGDGARGAGQYYAKGDAWSDGVANAATSGARVVNDVVTISNGSNFALTKKWDGSAWVAVGAVFDGSLFVTGSIHGSALKAGTVEIRKPDGTLLLGAGGEFGALVKTSNLQVGGDVNNLVPDPRFRDLAWWGMVGQNVSVGDWLATQPTVLTSWKYGASLYMGPTNGLTVESSSGLMPVVPGATYLVEYQIGLTADFNGDVSIEWHLPMVNWYGFGVPQAPGPAWPDGGPVHYNTNSEKKFYNVVQTVVLPNDTRLVNTNYRIRRNIRTGLAEIGGFTITRVVDSVLIKDGAIEARHLTIAQGGAINSGQWGFDQGDGFWMEGAGNGHGARMSLGSGPARLTFDSGTQLLQVKGAIEGSSISASVLSMNSARIKTEFDRLAPFTIYDTGMQFSSYVRDCSVTLSGFVGPGQGGVFTYNAKRFAKYKSDVILKAAVNGDRGSVTLVFEVMYNNDGWWRPIVAPSANCDYLGGFSVAVRYTTVDTWWDFIQFRARTGSLHTMSLCFEVQVANFNESTNPPQSNSGISAGDSSGSGGTNPREDNWCVDFETTVLPNGRHVRDLAVGDLVLVWNDDPGQPGTEYAPVETIRFGAEQSYRMRTDTGVEIIQSRSTPMTLRDGRIATTDRMLGEQVLVNRKGRLVWETVAAVEDAGVRKVVKVSLGDRMYFAGMQADATIATHNIQMKP